jgi:hypothetical protein
MDFRFPKQDRVLCSFFDEEHNYGRSHFADSTVSSGIAVHLQPPRRSHLQRCHPHSASRRPAPAGSCRLRNRIARGLRVPYSPHRGDSLRGWSQHPQSRLNTNRQRHLCNPPKLHRPQREQSIIIGAAGSRLMAR